MKKATKTANIQLSKRQIKRLMSAINYYDSHHGEDIISSSAYNKLFDALWFQIEGVTK